MSEPELLGRYTLLPWIKTGIGSQIPTNESELTTPRAEIPIDLSVNRYDQENNSTTETVRKDMALYGPGDIVGILNKILIRTEPKSNELTFEPNYFPHIEFSQPDFPWRFTPAKPNANSPAMGRLSPWLCLIVLKRDEFEGPSFVNGSILPQIKIIIDPERALPDLEQSWAFAHCQITNEVSNEQQVKEILTSESHRVISRILCLRDLDANTAYYAFLVPSFEVGRLAGIGQEVGNDISGTDFAWKVKGTNKSPVGHVLPVYYQWQFSSSEGGDFESLVRKLEARELPPDMGLRDLDVSSPFPAKNGITKPLTLGGVLWSINANELASTRQIDVHKYDVKKHGEDSPNPSEIRGFIMELKGLLDLPEKFTWSFIHQSGATTTAAQNDPIISPPIYGKWHARKRLISKISDDSQDPDWIKDLVNDPDITDAERTELMQRLTKFKGDPPYPWLEELNLDPVNRTTAGFGTVVVQDLQEELMASAWDQVGAVVEANKRLRLAQLSRILSKNAFERTLGKMNPSMMIGIVSPLHGKVIIKDENDKTISNLFARSPIPVAFFSPSFKKMTARRSKIHRKLFDANTHLYSDLLQRFNKNPSNPDPNPATPKVVIRRIDDNTVVIIEYLVTIDTIFQDPQFNLPLTEKEFRTKLDTVPDHQELNANEIERTIPPPDATVGQPAGTIVSLEKIHSKLVTALDPNRTIDTKISFEVSRPERLNEDQKDKLDPILAYPKFTRPMYSALRDRDQDLLLPGIENIPENTISLLQTNTTFLNSYMVGLNHEMARELLWREYPTDQRGTYFRQFWDASVAVQRERLEKQILGGGVPLTPTDEEAIVEKYRDIKEIHLWKKDSKLEESQSTTTTSSDERTVLIIKGELLRRYPGAIIYASKAVWLDNKHTLSTITKKDPNDPTGQNEIRVFPDLQEEIKEPIFRGSMYPDITFFGFDIPRSELRGKQDDPTTPPHADGTSENAGWYFVLQEQPSEPRFGLDERRDPPASLTKWDDLSWNHVSPLSASNYIDLQNGPLIGMEFNNVKWGSHAGDIANITLQNRLRVAVHASEMVPPS